MKIPQSIKIGSTQYKIKIDSKIKSWGEVNFHTKIISIHSNYAKHEIGYGVLFHEIFEAIKNQNNITCSHTVMSVFAEQVYTVLKENRLLK